MNSLLSSRDLLTPRGLRGTPRHGNTNGVSCMSCDSCGFVVFVSVCGAINCGVFLFFLLVLVLLLLLFFSSLLLLLSYLCGMIEGMRGWVDLILTHVYARAPPTCNPSEKGESVYIQNIAKRPSTSSCIHIGM